MRSRRWQASEPGNGRNKKDGWGGESGAREIGKGGPEGGGRVDRERNETKVDGAFLSESAERAGNAGVENASLQGDCNLPSATAQSTVTGENDTDTGCRVNGELPGNREFDEGTFSGRARQVSRRSKMLLML